MVDPRQAHQHKTRNRRVLAGCVVAVVGMVGLSYAAVPLYALFCRVTGYGGTTQIAAENIHKPAVASDVIIRVRFNADVNPALPWGFSPKQREMTVRAGENNLAFFQAENRSDRVITGQAVYNVTPLKVGQYFTKIACFCFDEQTLAPHESADMPVSFYVDPEIATDPNTRDVKTITLSYTFYKAEHQISAVTSGDASGG